ncbi:hypothetical protein Goklo_012104 [Gossypium klotzschianum]|uniref:Uncharacterized protein n=1 Tax=Gossypium klotzschianum TaxID=34286 RepID=A0A7J8VB57_9ROSI|nr:hypothetical protein [Gossypium klotzschianum]
MMTMLLLSLIKKEIQKKLEFLVQLLEN